MILVVFPFAFDGNETPEHVERAERFIIENKKRNPNIRILQLTDTRTAQVRGSDICTRAESEAFGLWYFDAMLKLEPPYLRLDYDCLIIKDVASVFTHGFDIAIAKEHKGSMNNGVVFVKDKRVFSEARGRYLDSTEQDNWQDIQKAMQIVIDDGAYRIKKLPQHQYNYIFKKNIPVPEDTRIIHFKGVLKGLMYDYYDDRWQPLGR